MKSELIWLSCLTYLFFLSKYSCLKRLKLFFNHVSRSRNESVIWAGDLVRLTCKVQLVDKHLSVQKRCTISGSFGMFIIESCKQSFALESVSWRDKLYFNSIIFKNFHFFFFKYWRTCILIKKYTFLKKKDHHAVGLPQCIQRCKRVFFFLLWNLFLTLINILRLRFSHFVIGTNNW